MTNPPPRATIAAILLDYGGTLDGDAQHWFDHFVRLYAEARPTLAVARIKDAFYAADGALTADPGIREFGLERMIRTHVAHQLRRLELDDAGLAAHLADRFIADTRAAWNRNRPLLARLAVRFHLGVVSNSYGNMPTLMAEAAFAPLATIIDSALEGVAKPDPAIYALAASRLALPAEAFLHVGDSWERDVIPARIAGMHAAWLARPEAAMPSTPIGVWRIGSLLDLEVLLT